jgi:hypothetical protein
LESLRGHAAKNVSWLFSFLLFRFGVVVVHRGNSSHLNFEHLLVIRCGIKLF